MSNFLERYKTNEKLEEDGVWVDFGGGVRVKIVRVTSRRSRDVRRKLERQYAKKYRNQDIPPEVMETILVEQLAQAIVQDWEGVTDLEGRAMEFNQENARFIFRKFKDFREDVTSASLMKETFLDEMREEDLGNSETSSSGS